MMETTLSISAGQKEYLSKEQFYKLCHISKSTASRLIKNGVVPAIDTQKKTRRYLIARKDVEAYLSARNQNPSEFASTVQHNIQTYGDYKEFSPENAIKLRRIAASEWMDCPDVLRTSDISALLGYRTETIYRWRKNLGLKGYIISGKLYFPKTFLLDFIAGPEFHGIQQKTIQHINLLRRAIHAGT